MRAWEASTLAAVAAIALFSRIARRTASRSESGSCAHRYPEHRRKSVFRIGLGPELRSQKPRCRKTLRVTVSGRHAVHGAAELLVHLPRHSFHGGIPHDGQHLDGIHCDHADTFALFVHHDVAWQQQSEVDFVLESLVGDGRVAGAENHIPREVDPQLFFELGLYIDVTKHSETLGFERSFGFGDGFLEGERHLAHVAILDGAGNLHDNFTSFQDNASGSRFPALRGSLRRSGGLFTPRRGVAGVGHSSGHSKPGQNPLHHHEISQQEDRVGQPLSHEESLPLEMQLRERGYTDGRLWSSASVMSWQASIVGRTPASAPDPLVRLLLCSSRPTRGSAAGQGGPPHEIVAGCGEPESVVVGDILFGGKDLNWSPSTLSSFIWTMPPPRGPSRRAFTAS